MVMKGSIAVVWLMLMPIMVLSQREHLDKADEFYKKRFYKEAIAAYKLALEEDVVVNKFYMTQQVARTYKMLFDYENAELWYSKLIALGEENAPVNYLHYAQLLQNNQKYEEAAEMFRLYAQKSSKDESEYKALGLWAIKPENKDTAWAMSITQTNIETGSRSMGIWLHKDHMYYGMPVIQEFDVKTSFYDLGKMNRKDSITFGQPAQIKGSTDRSFYEGTPFITEDGQYLYYTANASETKKYRSKKKREKSHISKEGLNILHIYRAENIDGQWTNIRPLNINTPNSSAAFPFISKDGKTLYFASNRDGGYGGYDLYKAGRINDSTWSAPINIGQSINTVQDEMYPFANDTAFFFSSKGRQGYGGADIYWGYMDGVTIGEIHNIGLPLNSSKDDFSFIIESDKEGLLKGYLSSNRKGTHGYDYVYYFNQHPWPIYPDTISGFAKSKITMNPLVNVKASLSSYTEDGKKEADSIAFTNTDGALTFILDKNVPYHVLFTKEGYQPVEFEIPADNREDVMALFGKIKMQPVAKKNTVIQIPNIYFDFDKASIREESYPILANIVKYLNDNPDIRVELSAHTDSRGSDWYNLKLSDRRAKSTVKYLVEKGIDKSRLVPKGYGEKKLQNHCKNGVECSDEDHEANRRVELKVL